MESRLRAALKEADDLRTQHAQEMGHVEVGACSCASSEGLILPGAAEVIGDAAPSLYGLLWCIRLYMKMSIWSGLACYGM